MTPQRVQLSRKRGWRMPPRTSKVDRSTRWGNPFKAGVAAVHPATGEPVFVRDTQEAVELFALFLQTPQAAALVEAVKTELEGKNLACWCKCGQVCHGDVLLCIANGSQWGPQQLLESPLFQSVANSVGSAGFDDRTTLGG